MPLQSDTMGTVYVSKPYSKVVQTSW